MRKAMNINPAGAERSRAKIEEVFEQVGERLHDGRSFLTGERFTIADLAFAALAAPVLFPPGHPFMPEAGGAFPGAARQQVDAWRASAAGRFGLRLYTTQR
jgi:glutathione S-transferase